MKLKRKDVLKKISRYSRKSRNEIMILIAASIMSIPVAFVSPYFFSILIDKVMSAKNPELFVTVAAGLLLVYGIRLLLDWASLICSNRISNRFSFLVRKDIWRKYLRLSYSDYEKKAVSDLKMRLVDDVDGLGNFVKDQVVDYLFSILMVAVSFGITIFINYKLTLICISITPLVFFINKQIGKGNKRVNEQIRLVNEEYFSFLHNTLQFWKEIKSQCAEKNFIDSFMVFRKELARLGYRQIRYWGFSEIFTDFKTNYLTKVFVYVIGSFFVIQGEMTVGLLVLFSESFGLLFTNIDAVNSKNVALNVAMPYYTRICEALEFIEDDEYCKQKITLSGNLQLSNISFRYQQNETAILDDVSMSMDQTDYLAVTGVSGSGKSTLLKLILNLYPVQNGQIEYDGVNVMNIKKSSLFSQIGVVMQDSYLFNMSIKDNLLLTNRDASVSELEEACRQADILDFIRSLPDGLNTVIGERGVKLSGGQKQRIAIAQAFMKNPKIIMFDEATSSIDKISEDAINKSISEIAHQTTVLIISHKPSAILRANRSIVIADGNIVAEDKCTDFMRNMLVIENAG